jgi:hypothetical protein
MTAIYGSLAGLFSPLLYSVLISYLGPREKFDWSEFLRIEMVRDSDSGADETSTTDEKELPSNEGANSLEASASPKGPPKVPTTASSDLAYHPLDAATLAYLSRWYKIAWAFLIMIVAVTFVAWPMPLYRDWVFTRSFFSGWVSVAISWQFFALCAVVIYPVVDGWSEISKSTRGLVKSLQQITRR